MSTAVRPMGVASHSIAGKVRDVLFLNLEFANIPAGGSLAKVLTFAADADVLVFAATRTVATVAAPQTVLASAPLTAFIRISSSARDLSNEAGHIENVFGTGQRPCYWQTPKRFGATETITVTLGNIDPAVAYRAWLTFFAVKLYDRA